MTTTSAMITVKPSTKNSLLTDAGIRVSNSSCRSALSPGGANRVHSPRADAGAEGIGFRVVAPPRRERIVIAFGAGLGEVETSPMVEVASLDEVPLREVWRDEARDFTPWLAAHPDHLGKALQMDLELEGAEVSVGRSPPMWFCGMRTPANESSSRTSSRRLTTTTWGS